MRFNGAVKAKHIDLGLGSLVNHITCPCPSRARGRVRPPWAKAPYPIKHQSALRSPSHLLPNDYHTIQVSRSWFRFSIEMVKVGGSCWCEQSAHFNEHAWTSVHIEDHSFAQ